MIAIRLLMAKRFQEKLTVLTHVAFGQTSGASRPSSSSGGACAGKTLIRLVICALGASCTSVVSSSGSLPNSSVHADRNVQNANQSMNVMDSHASAQNAEAIASRSGGASISSNLR